MSYIPPHLRKGFKATPFPLNNVHGKQSLISDEIHTKYKQLEDIAKYHCNINGSGCQNINNNKELEYCYKIYSNIYLLRQRMEEMLGKDSGHSYWMEKIGKFSNTCENKLKRRRFSKKRKSKSKKRKSKRSKRKRSKRKRSKRKKSKKYTKAYVLKRIDSLNKLLDSL